MAIAASGGQMADRDKHPEPLLAINPNTNKRLLDPGEPSNKRARPATRGPVDKGDEEIGLFEEFDDRSGLFEEIDDNVDAISDLFETDLSDLFETDLETRIVQNIFLNIIFCISSSFQRKRNL